MTEIFIITGASRGIGAATARLAAKSGAAVCINYRSGADEAEAVAADVAAAGGEALVVQANMAREADIVAMFERVDDAFGAPTVLVNNAGIVGPVARVANVEARAIEEVMATNVTGAFLCAREAVRRMSRANGGKGGAIVNVSSRASKIGGAGEWVHYAASKGAIDTLTIGLSREVGGEGIRVNAVSPGLIETEIHARAGMADRLDRLTPGVPMQRAGTADEVAETILWLASDAASYVNGAIVDISGGR